MKINIYKSSKDTRGVCVSLESVLSRIRSGARGLDEKTKIANRLAVGDPNTYRQFKASELPAVIFSAEMTGNGRTQAHATRHTGLVVIDFDNLADLGSTLATMHHDPHIFIAFVSPSGHGIKSVFRVEPVPEVDQHKIAFEQVVDYCENTYPDVDTAGSDINRFCFLAHDPLLIYKANAIPIPIDLTEIPTPVAKPIQHGKVDPAILDYINPDTLDYDDWLRVGFACKTAGLPCSVWDAWSRRGKRYQDEECTKRWDGFTKNLVTWATVVHFAKQNGYEPPKNRIYTMPITSKKPIIETRIQ